MMTFRNKHLWPLFSLLFMLIGAPAHADESKTFKLAAHGGASFDMPDYKIIRQASSVLVLEQMPDLVEQKPFRILMATIESASLGEPNWEGIQSNMIQGAGKSGRTLKLDEGSPFRLENDFAARRFSGQLSAKEKDADMEIELILLIQNERLVTFAVISEKTSLKDRELLEDIARSTRLL